MGLVVKNLIGEKHEQKHKSFSIDSRSMKENRDQYLKRVEPIYNDLDNLLVQVNNAKERGDTDTFLKNINKGMELIKQL